MKSVLAVSVVSWAVLVSATGCIVVRDSAAQGPANQASAGGEEPATPTTIAEVVAVCREVEKSRQIPVSCKVVTMSDGLSMIMDFGDSESAASYVEPMIQYVGGPFCGIANSSNRHAFLYFVVANGQKKYSCARADWEPDLRTTPRAPVDSSPPSLSFDQAIQNCNKVQASARAPVGCKMRYVQGKPALVMAFNNMHEAKEYIRPMVDYVATPFCVSATQQNVTAHILMVVGQNASAFSCRTGQWGEWVSLPETTASPSATRVPTY